MNTDEINALEQQIATLKTKLTELRRALPPEPVADFTFDSADGPVSLTYLFGDKDDLLTIHNMGAGCAYCTLWADGMNGFAPELMDRAAFVLISPDPIKSATAFAGKRGWRFPVVSDIDRAYSSALGRWTGEYTMPGVSALRKEADGSIYRVGIAEWGPGDDFCAAWPLFDLLKDGAANWEPNYRL